jgi:hypothetical protein
MKKLLVYFTLLSSLCATAQNINYDWAANIGGSDRDEGKSIVVDSNGDTYITGYFQGTADFDPSATTANLSAVGQDVFLAKYDASGNYLWANNLGGSSDEIGQALALDANGNIYVTGRFEGTVDFDPSSATATLSAAGVYDIFLAKYDAAGNYLWAIRMGSDEAVGLALAVSTGGDVYVTGYFSGTTDFDPSANTANLSSTGIWDVFLAKYDGAGTYLWANSMGGANLDGGKAVTLDANDNAYITGYFRGPADFDPSAGTATLNSAGFGSIFIAKYDALGNYQWAHGISGTGSDEGSGLALDGNGNLYVTGLFSDVVDFDPSSATANLTSVGISDVFLAKYDVAGNYIWANSMGNSNFDFSGSLALDANSNIYITGAFQQTADFDPSGATVNLNAAGSWDVYLAKYDAAGNYVWANRIGSTGTDFGNSIALDANGNPHITGFFEATADFDPSATTANLSSAGMFDVYLAKYSNSSGLSNGDDFNFSSAQKHAEKIKVYPNPSSSSFTVELEESWAQLSLVDASGKVLEELEAHHGARIEMGAKLNPGVYILQVQYQNGVTKTKRIVKVK